MSFTKGYVTLTRLKVDGPTIHQFGQEHLDRLADRQIGSATAISAFGEHFGWSAGLHARDTDFSLEKNVHADALIFEFTVQTDKLPPDRLRSYYEIELKALASNNPSGFASAKQKREARESSRERLEQEAKDGRFRKWKTIPVCWDARRKEVWLGSTSLTHAWQFTTLFTETFGADLTQATSYATNLGFITAGTIADKANDTAERPLTIFVKDVTPEEPYWCSLTTLPDYHGNEFFVWLWWWLTEGSDTLTLSDGSEITAMFSGGIKLDCPRGVTGNDTINADSGVRTPEAREALRTGKLPRKATLVFVRHNTQFTATIDAEYLSITGAKLPKPEPGTTARVVVEERIQHTRDMVESIDLLYRHFLDIRFSDEWPDVLRDIQGWIACGAKVEGVPA